VSLFLAARQEHPREPKKETMLDTQETKTDSSAPAADSSSSAEEQPFLGLTAKAAEKVKEIRVAEGIEDTMGLRLRVVGGGCSGFSYDLYFDSVADADRTLESHGVKLVVDQMSLMYLVGTEVDYVEGLQGAGFKFNNPNVKSTCGCGSSFSA
jgi:iron-sulfur cluster assembly accessory protein